MAQNRYNFENPAASAADAIAAHLLQQQQLKRQQMMDAMDMQLKQATLDKAKQEQDYNTWNAAKQMRDSTPMGAVLTPEQIQKNADAGAPFATKDMPATEAVPAVNTPASVSIGSGDPGTTIGEGDAPAPVSVTPAVNTPAIPAKPAQTVHAGTDEQQAAEQAKAEFAKFMADPAVPAAVKVQIHAKMSTGVLPSFELLQGAKADAVPAVGLSNPNGGNAVVFDKAGPKGAGYYDVQTKEFVPQPVNQAHEDAKATAAATAATAASTRADAAGVAKAARDSQALTDSYKFHTGELDKVVAPLEATEQRMSRLADTLHSSNPQTDALIPAELMVVMAGGQGSGVRINEAEINRVVGGATKVTEFNAWLNKWRLDPNTAQIPPAQRAQIDALIGLVNTKIQAKLNAASTYRGVLSNPDSNVSQHRQGFTGLHKTLTQIDSGTPAPTTDAPANEIIYGMDGKPKAQ